MKIQVWHNNLFCCFAVNNFTVKPIKVYRRYGGFVFGSRFFCQLVLKCSKIIASLTTLTQVKFESVLYSVQVFESNAFTHSPNVDIREIFIFSNFQMVLSTRPTSRNMSWTIKVIADPKAFAHVSETTLWYEWTAQLDNLIWSLFSSHYSIAHL